MVTSSYPDEFKIEAVRQVTDRGYKPKDVAERLGDKKERIKRKSYKTRDEAKADVFNYIEFFYNFKRRHGTNNGVSPHDFEKVYFENLKTV